MTDDHAIQLYRVDNPSGIWEYEDEAMRLHYRKRALEEERTRTPLTDTAIDPTLRNFGVSQRP